MITIAADTVSVTGIRVCALVQSVTLVFTVRRKTFAVMCNAVITALVTLPVGLQIEIEECLQSSIPFNMW